MNFDPQELRRHYESLTDEALLEIDPSDLTPLANQVLETELATRNLLEEDDPDPEEIPAEDLPEPTTPQEELVIVATFTSPSDARLAVSLLRSGQIPCGLDQAKFSPEINLMVPASLAEEAKEVLNSEVSDDDLAAQAQAAKPEEDAPED